MKTSLRILFTLSILQFAMIAPCLATDIVRIDAKYKRDAISAPDPDYPMKAQHLGYQARAFIV